LTDALEVGSAAPDFSLTANDGTRISLSDFLGKRNVVLYFYPKSDTPGCTAQACGFRDGFPAFESIDAVILGVSPDPVKKQAKFVDKYSLPFPILADPDHTVCEQFGVWKLKKFMGRTYMGVERTTFLIDKSGTIRDILTKFDISKHAETVKSAVAQLG
jgi:peroxiredoxin Q/BCP